jgi:hypothetical protein
MDEQMMPLAYGLRSSTLSTTLAALVATAVQVGCSSGSGSAGAAAKDSGAPSGDAGADAPSASGDDGGEDAPFSCAPGCPASTVSNATCVATVQATLVDPTGAPVAGQNLLVCGDNLCSLPGLTNSQGSTEFQLCEQMVSPALKFIAGAGYVSFATAVTQENTTFPPITVFPLPSTGEAFPTTSAGTVTSGPVTLAVAAGSVKFDPSQADDPNIQEFRAAQVDVTKVPAALPASLTLAIIWGLAPVNATLTPPGTLTIPNSASWPAGSKVDFYMNGCEPVADAAVPYGTWGSIGTGTVSADGTTISTDEGAGNGVPVLGMVGATLHP